MSGSNVVKINGNSDSWFALKLDDGLRISFISSGDEENYHSKKSEQILNETTFLQPLIENAVVPLITQLEDHVVRFDSEAEWSQLKFIDHQSFNLTGQLINPPRTGEIIVGTLGKDHLQITVGITFVKTPPPRILPQFIAQLQTRIATLIAEEQPGLAFKKAQIAVQEPFKSYDAKDSQGKPVKIDLQYGGLVLHTNDGVVDLIISTTTATFISIKDDSGFRGIAIKFTKGDGSSLSIGAHIEERDGNLMLALKTFEEANMVPDFLMHPFEMFNLLSDLDRTTSPIGDYPTWRASR